MASHCTIDKLPQSHGMRLSISSQFETVDHMLKAKIGVLTASEGDSAEERPPIFVFSEPSL